jgi:hypothetical protein
MTTTDTPRSPDMLKPVGHVMLVFRTDAALQQTLDRLSEQGFDAALITRYSAQEMVVQVDLALQHSSPLAAFGQELNLATAHRDMASAGCSFLLVPAAQDAQAQLVADTAQACGALSAQQYGRFVIVELIAHSADRTATDILVQHKLDAPTPAPAAE